MRKYILLFIALCLHIAARGQTVISLDDIDLSGLPQPTQAKVLRYWFDDDAGSVQTVDGLTGQYALDVSSLIEGLHTLHYQMIDTEDRAAYIRSGLFLKVGQHNESLSVKSMHYWFDDDASSVQTADGTTGTYLLDVSMLIEGLHTLHYQLTDESNVTAYVGSAIFLKMDSRENETSAKSLRYWFDDEEVSTESILSGGVRTIDVSALLDGLHTIHYQVVGNDGRVYYVASGFFLKMGISTGAETLTASKLMYWFDDDTTMQLMDVGEGVQMLDASELMEGLHTLHYQVLCNNGQMTPAMSSLFLRISIDVGTTVAKSLRYWYDDEQTATEVEITEGVQMLDASRLIEGLHTVHYQIANSNGTMGAPASSIFLKMDYDNAAAIAKSLRYWFDDETDVTETAVANGTQALDASRLIEGLHTVHYQIVDSNGTLGAPASSVFLKMNYDNAAAIAKSIRYWFDDDAMTVRVTDVANGTQTLDVSDLLTGLHTLNYQLIDSNGRVGVPVTRLFMKNFDKVLADGYNRVTKYQYWLNTNSQAMKSVTLDAAANPYTLISLLPMQKEPIHSDCFHFEVTNDVPTIYAKNILHVRFYDAQNYFTDGEKPFVDYSVKQEVTDAELLESGIRATTAKPAENTIKWYCLDASFGDSLSFKTNMACTLQLFSPTGEEVYTVSGNKSVTEGGIHAFADGVYYLAVHDVKGTHSSSLAIDYLKIDRYAILAYSPDVIGVPSESVVNLIGNGFDKSAKVSLFKDGTDYWAKGIHTEKVSELSALFDFEELPLGKYGLKVLYTPEDSVCIANAITVEEADSISDISIKLEGNPYFIAGGTANYSIRITNNSNLTVFSLPITLSIECEGNVNNVPYLKFDNDYTASSRQSLRNTFADILTPSELEELEHYVFGDNDLSMFYVDTLSHPGKAYLVGNFVIPQLEGNSSITMPFTLKKVNHNLTLYAATQPHWSKGDFINLEAQYANGTRKRAPRRSAQSSGCMDPCSMGVIAQCIVTITESAMPVGFSELLGDCIKSYVKEKFGGIFTDILCNGEEPDFSNMPKTPAPVLEDIVISLWDCASENMVKQGVVKLFGKSIAGKILKVYSVSKDCVYEPFQTFAGACPGDGDGGTALPIHSYDPNEMYGYVAESGSKAIKEGLTDVYYTIQFENDPEFATSAAHDIYLVDTLDAQKFDLSTFAPTRLKIGEKSAELTGDKNFVTTVDMRPEINAIAQVEGTYDQQNGIAKWYIISLDPMTMEPTDDPMDGVLPVNTNGNGIGEVSFDIKLKQHMADGTEIHNRASIVFDINEPILTPTWTNIVDAVAPTSWVESTSLEKADTVTLHFAGEDERSGVWHYTVYVQDGKNALWRELGVTDSCAFDFEYAEGIDYGFCVLATDSAGNVEQKELVREAELRNFIAGDANSDGVVDTKDAVLVISYYLGRPDTYLNMSAADIIEDGVIDTKDAVAIINKYLNTSGVPKTTRKNRKRIRVL